MSIRTIVVGIMAMVCGVSAAVGVNQMRAKTVQTRPGNPDVAIVPVAAVEIRRGDEITEEMLLEKEWPKAMVPTGAILDKKEIIGKVASTAMYKDEPLVEAKLGDAGVVGLISDGQRAYTILTKNDSALVAGLIAPGDHVDVLFTDQKSNKEFTGGGSTTPLLQNIEVLAIGKVLDPQETRTTAAKDMRSVTLLVTLDMASKLSLAQEIGTLNLALRSGSDEATAAASPITLNELLRTMYPAYYAAKDAAEKAAAEPEPEPVVQEVVKEEPVAVAPPKRDIHIRTMRGIARGSIVMRTTADRDATSSFLSPASESILPE